MPSSTLSHSPAAPSAAAFVAPGLAASRMPRAAHFEVVPFRRAADGTIVPGSAFEVSNGDIAWRWARAAARDHDNVGAVALTGSDVVHTGKFTDGALLTSFGEVNLDALTA